MQWSKSKCAALTSSYNRNNGKLGTLVVWIFWKYLGKQQFRGINNFLQNLRSSLTKRKNSLKTCLWEQRYNLKAIMRRDHKKLQSESVPVCLYLYYHEDQRHQKLNVGQQRTEKTGKQCHGLWSLFTLKDWYLSRSKSVHLSRKSN